MDQEKINKEFELFEIPKQDVPRYTDPYAFTRQIRKCIAYRIDQVTYSNNTIFPERVNHAKLE